MKSEGDTFQLCPPSVVVGAASVRGLVVASLSSSLSLSHGAQPSRSGGQIVNAELAAAAIAAVRFVARRSRADKCK